ncbi:MAG: type I-U CRISPR-associated protein Csb2 [Phycisphaeraceae bacterium]
MPGLTIGWEYLTGYAVATDPSSRERAEWPPHPGRVFMALAAAWFETGQSAAEGDTLRWLEQLGDPELHLPPREQVAERSNVTFYVPVNDKAGPAAATLQSAPTMTRSKQPRTFPRVHVGDAPCTMHWPEAEGVDDHREALAHLCSKVTRIGHSSSLVRMWVAEVAGLEGSGGEHLLPADQLADQQVRSISNEMLDMLIERFGENACSKHAQINEQINALKASRKAAKGKGAKERKEAIDAEIRTLENQLSGIAPRPPIRPTLGLWSGYRRADGVAVQSDATTTHFDTDVLMLIQVAGPTLPAVSTLILTWALRGAVMKHSGVQPVPQWVSGHQADGSACDDGAGHMGCIPLPFVGHEHADGHLLGMGLVFPRSVDRPERGRVLGPLLMNSNGKPREIELKLGRLGVWTVKKRDWSEQRGTLQPETWTAHPTGAATWASVTPVVLDRFPKADRVKDRVTWAHEVAGIVKVACTRIGLPEPVNIDIDTTCWHRGGARAIGKRRLLRGHDAADGSDAVLGDGFPCYPAKGANASRPQVHVWLEFAEPIIGPVLIGAGRYLGYGLCRPLNR